MHEIINEKRDMSLKESTGLWKGLEKREGRDKWYNYIMISKKENKIKKLL